MSWFNWLRGVKPAPIDDNDNPSTAEVTEGNAAAEIPEVPSVTGDASALPATDEPEVTATEVYQAFHTNQVAAEA